MAQCDFTFTINSANPLCFGMANGSIIVTTDNPSPHFQISILNSNGDQMNIAGLPNQSNYPEGWYFITVTDSSGCSETDSIELIAPPEMQVAISLTHPECGADPTGSAQVDTVYNAQGNYDQIYYVWSSSPNHSNGFFQTQNNDLYYGAYTLGIFDAFGCSIEYPFELIAPDSLYFTDLGATIYEPNNLGGVYCMVAGGISPYQYQWTNLTNQSIHTTPTWTGLDPGDYSIHIIDSMGCSIGDTLLVGALNNQDFTTEIIQINPTIITDQQLTITNPYPTGDYLLTIIDINGRQVLQQTLMSGQQNISTLFNPGLYYFSIRYIPTKQVHSNGPLLIK